MKDLYFLLERSRVWVLKLLAGRCSNCATGVAPQKWCKYMCSIPSSSKCLFFFSHQKKLPTGRNFAHLEDPGHISTEKFRIQYGEIPPISIHVTIATSEVIGLRHVQLIRFRRFRFVHPPSEGPRGVIFFAGGPCKPSLATVTGRETHPNKY